MVKNEDGSKGKKEVKPETQPTSPPLPLPTPTPTPAPQPGIMAILSVVFGALGFISNGLFGVVGLILGVVELNNIKKDTSPESGKTLAIVGIVLGAFNLIMLVIVIVLAVFFGASFCGCGLCSAWLSALSEGAKSVR